MKQQIEQGGMPYDEMQVKRTLLQDPDVRSRVTEQVLSDMVDFTDLGKFERDYVASVFPFWAWMKGSSKASFKMLVDQPENVWAMAQIGDHGAEVTNEQMGSAVPEFARSWILPHGKMDGLAINTGGMIPWEQPLDLAASALGLLPGGVSYRQYGADNLLGSMHPLLAGSIEGMTGRDLFTGTPLPNESWGTTLLKRQLDLPIINMLNPNSLQYQQANTATRERDPMTAWANWAGATYFDPRWGAVHERGVEEARERYGNTGTLQRLAEIAG